jgi:hypothetical protein
MPPAPGLARGGRGGQAAAQQAPAAAAHETKQKVRVSLNMKHTLQTILQAAASANENKVQLPTVLRGLKLSTINFNSNPGEVVAALLEYADIHSGRGGKKLWRGSQQEDALEWQAVAKVGSLRPAERRTAFGDVAAANVAHDPQPHAGGTAAARETARAAQVDPPVALGLAPPDPADRLDGRRGSGWGSVPRPLTARCVVEMSCLDDLVQRVKWHERCCEGGAGGLKRVDGGGGAFRSSHSMGAANVCRYICECGYSFNWASARALPGPPARARAAAAGAAAADPTAAEGGAAEGGAATGEAEEGGMAEDGTAEGDEQARRAAAEAMAAGHSMTSIEAFRVAAVNWRARGQPTAGGGQ